MQRRKLLGMFLMTGSCLALATVAPAEPVSKPPPKKHAECEGSKVKTACNQAADVKEFVTGRQAPSASAPTADADLTAAAKSQQVQAANDGGGEPQQPQ